MIHLSEVLLAVCCSTCVFALEVGGESPDILTTGYFHYFGFMEGLIFGEMFAMGGWVGGGGGI